MKLKTTIYGKPSTLIGTPDEVAEFLTKMRHKTPQRLADFANAIKAQKIVFHEPFKPTFEPIAQTREEIVNEAIADVAELLSSTFYGGEVKNHVRASVDFTIRNPDRVDFFINKNKRIVVAKLWLDSVGTSEHVLPKAYATTGIARCAPSDVFNEHVGKAIALRRALGLEVPTKYYEVGDKPPEGKQIGDVVRGFSYFLGRYEDCLLSNDPQLFKNEVGVGSLFATNSKVIDDSARYVAPSTPAAKVVYVD